ncbi:MAG: 16S rRNA (adenine(1518)-N(6)/adenine(1519)-N(6))-dimethyltransferase RsmA [Coprobacillaceae bacterium]
MKDIATRSTTTYILEKYHLQALKKYGQNFLIDSNIIHNIVSSANIDNETCVIEIGPGIGALTQILARTAKKAKCFEIDQRFKNVYAEFLTEENIEIVFQDFLDVDIKQEIDALKKEYKKVCLVANLPYYITTQIIEKVILSNCNIDSMVVMVQKEVALKYTSNYKNPLLLMIEDIGSISYAFTVSKNVFLPAPRVDSAILKITKERDIDIYLYNILQKAFKQRRKTIYNNLKDSYKDIDVALKDSAIEKNKRSEELTLEDFKRLTKNIK